MLFSLKDLTSKLSPDSQGIDHLHTVKTNSFTLHHYQSPSGLMFVLNTHADLAGSYHFHTISFVSVREVFVFTQFLFVNTNRFAFAIATCLFQHLRGVHREEPIVST